MGETVRAYPQWPNLPTMMLSLGRQWAERPMLRGYRDGAWRRVTWGAFAQQAASAAVALRASGICAGDRVVIVSENRAEYVIAETALMAIRAVPVPAYVTNTAGDHAHILRDSGARVAIVSARGLAETLLEGARQAGGLDRLIGFEKLDLATNILVSEWAALVAVPAVLESVASEAAMIPPGAMACLIYTSGTGGAPKGVMLSHRAILSNCHGAFELVRPLGLKNEVYLSFLPLSHSYEHTVGQFFLPSIGTEIVYSRGLEHLSADLLEVRPTIMTTVPRVLEVIRARIMAQVKRQKPWQQWLFALALAVGERRATGQMRALDYVLDPVLQRVVRARVMARFGGRFFAAMSGGARLEPEVGRFFMGLGLIVMQGYGQTEAGPVISANPPDRIRIETVGKPLRGVELKLAEDGEILVRGDLVMDGYWNLAGETAEVLRDGWLHTGDIGSIDAEGYVHITDRKKDMIVLSGGENVSPAKIEGMLTAEPEIAQAVLAGDGRAGLSALLVAAEEADGPAVAAAVARVNHRLSLTERVRRHALVGAFTVENGLMTPTQKVRRRLVIAAYAEVLQGL
jgi:long-chain acyl-CoA synthetase